MDAQAPEVLADPLGVVVDLVAGLEPGLGRARIIEVVAGVAGGRAKRRRLAQALLARRGFSPMAAHPGRSRSGSC